MNYLDLVLENPESTVVAKYERDNAVREEHYQSEAQLEQAFIRQLTSQAYERLFIHTEQDLILNLRHQLERLNSYIFSETEWKRFFNEVIANKNSGITEKSEIIQQNEIQLLTRDDGTTKNIRLVDKGHIHNNHLQVLNQYEVNETPRQNRYDVTVLINGLPLVHIELKRRGVDIREAFNQINRYQRESFWAGSGLFEYVQLFVISNGTLTKYYSNSTRDAHLKEQQGNHRRKQKTSHSFEFTSWWADAENKPITELVDFTKTFFAKHSLLKILFRYCVFTSDRLLLVMRPYQIVATERILNKLQIAQNYKQFGSVDAGGYIWHTTGSGKTLTSFKTAQLASQLPFIHKVLFVVDRKDLDYQTMKEYDKFQQGAANSNTSTKILTQQLSDPNAKIIITTIQKLAIFIKRQSSHQILNENMVLIFDECHRSQFGEMHQAITKAFKKYALFGFTGTPIFAKNAQQHLTAFLTLQATTAQTFGAKLHTYTIVNAIADKNVLPFRVDYVRTVKEADNVEDKKVTDIDRERALNAPERIQNIVAYILQHFAQKTFRNKSYFFNRLSNIEHLASAKDRSAIEEIKTKIRLSGFNSIFAVSSIDTAKSYYQAFAQQQSSLPEAQRLKIATIFSYGANDAFDEDNIDDENSENTEGLSVGHRDFLEKAITDYNQLFNTNYDTSAEKFQNYYRDVSLRMKNREIDLLIVVNMFLTGFDATTLNTLWVDKNLKNHGLLQAYSRTNRILNSVKRFGNIVCFRNLEKATNESIALFGDKEAGGLVLMKSFQDYYEGYEENGKRQRGYKEIVAELLEKFPIGERIESEKAKKEFIKLYGTFLKLQNILSVFDQFKGLEILTERDVQDYHSLYIDLYEEFRQTKENDAENINDDIVFEMELIKQVEINIDYILELIRQYQAKNGKDKTLLVTIEKAVDASVELRNKKVLIQTFIHSLTPNTDIDESWRSHIEHAKQKELGDIIHDENLNPEATQQFVNRAFENGVFSEAGTLIDKVLPPMSRFTPDNQRSKKRQTVLGKLKAFFERFLGI
ncbi:DEAD/DEAH box helicase [Rodentibacter trehalosifermentans]|uniref:Type I restriction enzyme endonuclease subunit n=1 Tax=Rodentibacter trehalosifermentans TaxID=1908263 RepID=A0A1V3IWC5_9PAST|nr:type I restriction endonuclease subunit R [Rodentibacter trehalosifermentans]OOF46390.1 DEAD/DEAH box helicase [Rodentibacter trehalosifermentans]